MLNLGKSFALILVASAFVLSAPPQSRAANCGADLKKARAEWKKIQEKGDNGELDNYGPKPVRAMDRFLYRATKAYKAGKNKRCADQLRRLRGRWHEKDWQ